MHKILLLVSVVLIYGCDGFGIAGAGRDSKQNLSEVEDYKAYLAPQISEKEIPKDCKTVVWHTISDSYN